MTKRQFKKQNKQLAKHQWQHTHVTAKASIPKPIAYILYGIHEEYTQGTRIAGTWYEVPPVSYGITHHIRYDPEDTPLLGNIRTTLY